MTELKTLEDFTRHVKYKELYDTFVNEEYPSGMTQLVFVKKLRAEAIKWIKLIKQQHKLKDSEMPEMVSCDQTPLTGQPDVLQYMIKEIESEERYEKIHSAQHCIAWIMLFFNISEEELADEADKEKV